MTASENGILQEIKKEHIDDVFEELSDDIITAWEPIRVKLSLTLVKQRSPTATKEFVNKLHRFFTSQKISQCNRLLQHLDATGANCALKKFDCFFCGEKSYSNFRMIVHKCEQHEMNIDEPKMNTRDTSKYTGCTIYCLQKRSKAKCKQELLLAVDVIIYQSVKSSHSSSAILNYRFVVVDAHHLHASVAFRSGPFDFRRNNEQMMTFIDILFIKLLFVIC
ncbi:hypothetical protein Tsp_11945 [Trichinella spiralis]|uniref:hypothetical protein n=1 Tax=Trichinella spiralis TaxID=6334 RepID=UPI0001EFD3E2|nr:hypothetical protein Tsp_11945 [Trichinella spiralis]